MIDFLMGRIPYCAGGSEEYGDMVAFRVISGCAESPAKPAFSEQSCFRHGGVLTGSGHHCYVVHSTSAADCHGFVVRRSRCVISLESGRKWY